MTSPTPDKPLSSSNRFRSIFIVLGALAAVLSPGMTIKAQTTHYLYGLHNTSGAADAANFNLVQFAVANPYGASTVTSSTRVANLGSYVSNYGAAGRYREYINGLAIDITTNDVYFNYTYNDNSASATAGNYTFQLYKGNLNGSVWEVDLVHSITAALAGGLPDSDSAGSGAFPRGAFDPVSNSYYTGGQLTDSLTRLNLNASGTAVTSIDNFSNFDLTPFGDYGGGDFVISNGTLYTSTVVDGENRLIRRTISGIENGTGFAAGVIMDDDLSFDEFGVVQIAGLGAADLLYGLSNSGSLFRFTNPGGGTEAALGITEIVDLSSFIGFGSVADISEALLAPIPVPEPSGALLIGVAGCLAILRRRRQS
ncbi:PEP-CTERM sorting domain-containing protein [Phragmitibacter flavus]|uniref:PEP-CTERM sorting domain-containing protein n=1 Tax=Phragmitibacter flavus TaxID=2576071 RepID=A0A5R8KB04_9BACT|nr:PEP-CTERM sorting domain-containing protein [Phragmitibacter flavus]TLD69493.1 PEP-CTERM sorting domain-containing protein [Phragmitibacter flavus]